MFGRADLNLSPAQRLTVRANTGDEINENIEPFGGITAKSRAGALDSRDWMIAGMHGWTVTPHVYNDLRVQVANRNQVVRSLDPACGGPCIDETMGGPQVNVAGVANLGRQEYTPQTRRSLRYPGARHRELADRSRTTSRAGFDFSTIDFSKTAFPYFFGGQYIFVDFPEAVAALFGLPTAISGIQALALGLPGAYIQGYGHPRLSASVKDLSLFAQDECQRLEQPVGEYRRPLPGAGSARLHLPDSGLSRPVRIPAGQNNVAPRLSIAWDPGGRGRTGVHGSYGMFYDNTFSAIPGVPKMIDGIDGVRVYVMQGMPAHHGVADARPAAAGCCAHRASRRSSSPSIPE